MKLFDGPLTTLEHSLDVRARRHEVLSGNLANIDTPGYVAKDLDFETAMAQLTRTDSRAGTGVVGDAGFSGAAGFSVGDGAFDPADSVGRSDAGDADHLHSNGLDGNTVDLDRTMAALAENGLQYGASARMASKHLAMLRTVINDGNG